MKGRGYAPGSVIRREREQRRAAAKRAEPGTPGLLPQAACDGKAVYYLQVIKGNQPTLMESIAARLTGTDDEFADESWAEEGTGHGRRERRSIRTAPASRIDWPAAQQVIRCQP